MKRNLLLVVFSLMGSMAAVAQEGTSTPVAEVGMNYSYTNTMPGAELPLLDHREVQERSFTTSTRPSAWLPVSAHITMAAT